MAGADDLRPLDAAIDEIRILREAAEHAAERIAAETEQLRGAAGAEGLVVDIADALVERTETIRADCERLDGVLRRARGALVASGAMAPREQDQAATGPGPAEPLPPLTPGAYAGPPRHSDEKQGRSYPFAPAPVGGPPIVEEEPEPPVWQFWRRRRRGPQPGQLPPRLPRPDYSAAGVESAPRREEPAAPGQPAIPEGVRLIATQMAIAGASKVEIERRLQRQFGITDAGPVLNDIFGQEESASPVE